MKRIIFVLGTLMLLYCIFSGKSSEDRVILPNPFTFGEYQEESPLSFSAVIHIVNKDRACSGWVVDKHFAITAAHCINTDSGIVKDPYTVYDDVGEDTMIKAQAIAYDRKTDMGLLTGDFSKFNRLPTNVNNEGFPINRRTTYLSCGFPLSQKHLSCTYFIPTSTSYFMIAGSGHLIPGYSGGPVIDLDTGEAVAINSALSESSVIVAPVQGILGLFRLE